MGYQSKTYSLSDEVVEAINAARAEGETPNRFLTRMLLLSGTRDPEPLVEPLRKPEPVESQIKES